MLLMLGARVVVVMFSSTCPLEIDVNKIGKNTST